MESIREVFTLLKGHKKTPQFCQGLSEEQIFPLGQFSQHSTGNILYCFLSASLIHTAVQSCFLFYCNPMFFQNIQLMKNNQPSATANTSSAGRPLQERDQVAKSISSTTLTLPLRGDEESGGIKDTNPWSTRMPSLPPSSTDRVKSAGWFSIAAFLPFSPFYQEGAKARILTVFLTEHNRVLTRHCCQEPLAVNQEKKPKKSC